LDPVSKVRILPAQPSFSLISANRIIIAGWYFAPLEFFLGG
jgi:hypothetical protein